MIRFKSLFRLPQIFETHILLPVDIYHLLRQHLAEFAVNKLIQSPVIVIRFLEMLYCSIIRRTLSYRKRLQSALYEYSSRVYFLVFQMVDYRIYCLIFALKVVRFLGIVFFCLFYTSCKR